MINLLAYIERKTGIELFAKGHRKEIDPISTRCVAPRCQTLPFFFSSIFDYVRQLAQDEDQEPFSKAQSKSPRNIMVGAY